MDIGSTILNPSAIVNGAAINSLGYNLSSDNGGGFLTAAGDQTNSNPRLGPLQLNGGQTPTHALMSSSPAIDAGTNFTGVTTDQRGTGFPRTFDVPLLSIAGDGTDIGAFEVQSVNSPGFTSASSTNFLTGFSSAFSIVATGLPLPVVWATGPLPPGVSLSATGLLSGIPQVGSAGVYAFTVIASNGVPPVATQDFTLTITEFSPFAARPSFNTNGFGWLFSGTVDGNPITNNTLTLTDGPGLQSRGAWFGWPLYIGGFEASFTYQDISGGAVEGMGFVIQNDPRGPNAIGLNGGGLGYSGIANSVALLLSIYGGDGMMLGTNGIGAFNGSGNPSGRDYESIAPVNLSNRPIDI